MMAQIDLDVFLQDKDVDEVFFTYLTQRYGQPPLYVTLSFLIIQPTNMRQE